VRARVCVCGQGVLDAYGGKAHGEEERKEREKNKEKRAGTTGRRDERREKRGKRRRRKEDRGDIERVHMRRKCAQYRRQKIQKTTPKRL